MGRKACRPPASLPPRRPSLGQLPGGAPCARASPAELAARAHGPGKLDSGAEPPFWHLVYQLRCHAPRLVGVDHHIPGLLRGGGACWGRAMGAWCGRPPTIRGMERGCTKPPAPRAKLGMTVLGRPTLVVPSRNETRKGRYPWRTAALVAKRVNERCPVTQTCAVRLPPSAPAPYIESIGSSSRITSS